MKLVKNKLGVVLGAALSFGVVGQASADVYGLSTMDISNLLIDISSLTGAQTFSFTTDQNASLNGTADGTDGSAGCVGFFPSVGSCTGVAPVLSGTVQNAPGGGVVRGENDYTVFGQTAEYSNAESAVVSAVLVGDAATEVTAISESNLQTGTLAAANTTVNSNTSLSFTFTVSGDGTFSISYDAFIDVLSEVTGGDLGLAQANSGVTVILQSGGVVAASWAPTGDQNVTTCGAGLVCTATETALSLNNSTSSDGIASQVTGNGSYRLDVTGLASGTYTLALAMTTSTNLARVPVPVPGTLMLLGTGLLLGARATRRNKK